MTTEGGGAGRQERCLLERGHLIMKSMSKGGEGGEVTSKELVLGLVYWNCIYKKAIQKIGGEITERNRAPKTPMKPSCGLLLKACKCSGMKNLQYRQNIKISLVSMSLTITAIELGDKERCIKG